MTADLREQHAALRHAVWLLGFDADALTNAIRCGDEPTQCELALRSTHLRFDDWTARRIDPLLTPLTLERAQAWWDRVRVPVTAPIGLGASNDDRRHNS